MTKFRVVKRSIVLDGVRTSVSLEEPFWETLKEVAKTRGYGLSDFVSYVISKEPDTTNRSSILRQTVLTYYIDTVSELRSRLNSNDESPSGQDGKSVFYFDLKDGVRIRDFEGSHFRTDREASQHGKQIARLVQARDPSGEQQFIYVVHESGRLVEKIPTTAGQYRLSNRG